MRDLDYLILFLAALLSLVLPAAIIAIRESVKSQRQKIIKDLETTFNPPDNAKPQELIIPSFEFVKFKYFMDQEAEPEHRAEGSRPRSPDDVPIHLLVVSSIPLMLVLLCLGIVAFGALLGFVTSPQPPPPALFFFPGHPQLWLIALVASYLGAYLFVIRELLRSVANFDLGPTTLLSSAVTVLFGAVTAVIIATATDQVFPGNQQTTISVLIVGAFAVGFVPELGLRTLLRTSRLRLFKRDDTSVYKAFTATPLEIIDGIDASVSSRLALSNIVTVQNLAAANPIMLFVETPYGVYEVIDWVAQAQLCEAVGTRALVMFWSLGIRTIFDLERAVFENSTMQLRHEIGKIIVAARDVKQQDRLGLGPKSKPSAATDQTVKALVGAIVSNLHVQRMRQIWKRISDRLGSENLRLAPSSSSTSSTADSRVPEAEARRDADPIAPAPRPPRAATTRSGSTRSAQNESGKAA